MIGGLMAVAVVGCKAIWDIEVEIDTPIGEGSLRIIYDGNELDVVETPEDAKVDVEFLDENGDPIEPGAQGVSEGDSVEAPPGAKSVAISGASSQTGPCVGCVSMATPPWDTALSETTDDTIFVEKWIQFLPLVPNYSTGGRFGNACFSAEVRVPDTYDTFDIFEFIEPILLYGPGYPVPHGATGLDVSITSFTRYIPNRSSVWPFASSPRLGNKNGKTLRTKVSSMGMTVYSMDETSDYDAFDLTLNGIQVGNLNLLTPSQYYGAPNGWKVVEIDVPTSVLIYNATSASMFGHLRTRTMEDDRMLETNFNLAARE